MTITVPYLNYTGDSANIVMLDTYYGSSVRCSSFHTVDWVWHSVLHASWTRSGRLLTFHISNMIYITRLGCNIIILYSCLSVHRGWQSVPGRRRKAWYRLPEWKMYQQNLWTCDIRWGNFPFCLILWWSHLHYKIIYANPSFKLFQLQVCLVVSPSRSLRAGVSTFTRLRWPGAGLDSTVFVLGEISLTVLPTEPSRVILAAKHQRVGKKKLCVNNCLHNCIMWEGEW